MFKIELTPNLTCKININFLNKNIVSVQDIFFIRRDKKKNIYKNNLVDTRFDSLLWKLLI